MNHRRTVAAAVALVALGLAGCAGGSSTSSGAPGAGTSPAPTVQPSDPSSPTPSASASTDGDVGKAAGACSLIDQATAEQLLGGTVKTGLGAKDLGKGNYATKLDGCTYIGSIGSLGYDVAAFTKLDPDKMLAMAQAKMKSAMNQGGPNKPKEFDTGLQKTFAFTMTAGSAGVDSQVSSSSGEWFVTVAVTNKAGDRAASQAAAISAMQTLLAGL